MNSLVAPLLAPRSVALLLALSFSLSAAHALTVLPLSLILGHGPFWDFPRGIVPGSASDMADGLVGYLYFVQSSWTMPLLQVPNLGDPAGTNIFWIDDAIGWVSILGKLIHASTGAVVNLLGFYLFACFTLGGVAMTALIAAAGQRNLLGAVTGAVYGTAMPFFLFRWGHMALGAQFLIVFGLGLYLKSRIAPRNCRLTAAWLGLLSMTLLTNAYLFVMVGGCWAAALAQRRLNGATSTAELTIEGAGVVGVILGLTLLMGILSADLRFAGSNDFGLYSMNVASPVIPQMSGVVPGFADYRVGPEAEYEGFAYLGLGLLGLLVLSLPAALGWIRLRARSHAALICVFACMLLLAISNTVHLGDQLVFDLRLPEDLAYALGALRSSGRFFWLVGYALAGGAIVLTLRRFRAASATVVLALSCVTQLTDVQPIREAVAATAVQPAHPAVDREAAAALVARSTAVLIFPSIGCVRHAIDEGSAADSEEALLRQANMEFQLLGARANLRINSVYNSRLATDCQAEDAALRQPLQSGALHVYLVSFLPSAAQLRGHEPSDVCSRLDWIRYCLVRSESPDTERQRKSPPTRRGSLLID
ncbi:MAG TPA: DUF6311 domain-containing protein [Stellaceae bacterium]|nr:DUF6311 domain-containing protein [Stellaceae bacterium]